MEALKRAGIEDHSVIGTWGTARDSIALPAMPAGLEKASLLCPMLAADFCVARRRLQKSFGPTDFEAALSRAQQGCTSGHGGLIASSLLAEGVGVEHVIRCCPAFPRLPVARKISLVVRVDGLPRSAELIFRS